MDFENYLNIFQKVTERIDKNVINEKQIEVSVGVVLDSVFLKLYKKSWINAGENPLTAETRIFFSIWVNDSSLREQKIFYNIHALKLRKLKGYQIESRKFANSFRKDFKKFENEWQNGSLKFGPLTLMEGWVEMDEKKIENDILKMANSFMDIEYLIDKTLSQYRK